MIFSGFSAPASAQQVHHVVPDACMVKIFSVADPFHEATSGEGILFL
jgi:hypothetical protein